MEIEAIKKLIETDEQTRAQVQAAHQKKYDQKNAIDAEKKQLSEEAWKAVNDRVASTKKTLDDSIAKNEADNQAYFKEASAKLTELYARNKDQWRKQLVARITDPGTKEQ